MKRAIFAVSVFCALALGAGSCSIPSVAGATSETTNGTVAATVTYPDGSAASGAAVTLRKNTYLSPVAGGIPKASRDRFETNTDSEGRFEIGSLDSGAYRIEVNDGESMAVLLECSLDARERIKDLDTARLAQYAAVAGIVDTSAHDVSMLFVQVEGLERLVQVDPDGWYDIPDLPAGEYTIRIVSAQAPDSAVRAVEVTAVSGRVTDVPLAGWKFSRRLYLNTTASGAGVSDDVYGFPLLVRLDSSCIDFSQAKDSGQDIRFRKADATALPYELEYWNGGMMEAAIWVRVDTVKKNNSAQYILMYWGNPDAASQSNGTAVFDTADGFAGVWHLAEEAEGTGTSDVYKDATANRFHGGDWVIAAGRDGVIGNGHEFRRVNKDYIDLGNDRPFLDSVPSVMLEFWVNRSAENDSASSILCYSIASDTTTSLSRAYVLIHRYVRIGARAPDTSEEIWATSNESLIPGEWYHVAALFNYAHDSLICYVNGERWISEQVQFMGLSTSASPSRCAIVGSEDDLRANFFDGYLDEVRTQRIGRNESWIRLCYENQRPDQRLIEIGKDSR
jgi:hypothetical protein